nr:MMPL family transporter [bacterium]
MIRYIRFVIRYRVWVLAAVALVTIAAGVVMSRAVLASSIGKMFLGESPAYRQYLERNRQFGDNDVLVVVVAETAPLGPAGQERLRRGAAAVGELRGIVNVRSLLDAQRVDGSGDELRVDRFADLIAAQPERKDELFAQLRDDPLNQGLFVSPAGDHHALVLEFDTEADLPAEKIPAIIDQVLAALQAAGYERVQLHIAGFPAAVAAMIEETHFNISRLFPLVCLALLIAAWLMFRRLWPVALTMIVALIGVIWTMGFATLIDRHISILVSTSPAMILIVSFSDVVHLCSAYLLELGRGRKKDEAILASVEDVGRACLLTSLTTFLGFAALSFVPAPVFRQMGVILGFGVGIALLLAVTLTPIFFSIIRQPKPWRKGATGQVQDLLDRFLIGSERLTQRRPWAIIALFAALTAVSLYGLSQVRIDTDFIKRLSPNNQVRRDSEYIKQHFHGLTALDIWLTADADEGLLDPQLFRNVAAFQRQAEALDDVDRVYSLVDLTKVMHREMLAGDIGDAPLPATRQALAQYLLLFEMGGGKDLDRLIDTNRSLMRISLQLPNDGVVASYETGRRVQALAERTLGEGVRVESSGLMYLMGQWLDEIVAGQKRGLLFAFLTIAAVMIIGLRSWRVGAWSMAPNAIPLLVLL